MRVGSRWKRRASTCCVARSPSGILAAVRFVPRRLSAASWSRRSSARTVCLGDADAKRSAIGPEVFLEAVVPRHRHEVQTCARCQPDHPKRAACTSGEPRLVHALWQWTDRPCQQHPRNPGKYAYANGYSSSDCTPGPATAKTKCRCRASAAPAALPSRRNHRKCQCRPRSRQREVPPAPPLPCRQVEQRIVGVDLLRDGSPYRHFSESHHALAEAVMNRMRPQSRRRSDARSLPRPGFEGGAHLRD